MYIHFPSADHAPVVHSASSGPTLRGDSFPLNATNWHGVIFPCPFICTTSIHLPSGDKYEWCAIPRSSSGKYTSRCWPRASSVVTTPMCSPLLISENISRFPFSIQVIDDAFLSINRGSPPITGTSHTSHGPTTLYAICEPSGENIGDIFTRSSFVSGTGSPDGNNFTYTFPAPKRVPLPRMNVSIRPSGESSGYTAETVKNVNCSHCPLFFGAISFCCQYTSAAIPPNAAITPAAIPHLFRVCPTAVIGVVLPDSVSRRNRCKSARISAAL